ncbi:MAG: hypothetical protein K2M73_09930 [Lachnospiraceae bacterium]|nr:hypothetical protein [Lachnospiraceae bacterium]
MTAEEVFEELCQKYGDDFIWRLLPFSDKYFVNELRLELGEHCLFDEPIYAVAKCEANDDVLYVCDNDGKNDIYRIYHLTYNHSSIDLTKYIELIGIDKVKQYIEQQYIENYL